jgi:hypothetical protein
MTEAFADDLRTALAPLATPDLATYAGAIGAMFAPVDDLVRDTDAGDGWTALLDVDRAPADALAFLAQFVGVRLQADLTDAAQRARIVGTDGFKRGSAGAVRAAAQQYLTGARRVIFRERDGGAYRLTVITYTADTPDPAAVLRALLAQKPAGIILTHLVENGQDYQQVRTIHATYAAVKAAYPTYGAMTSA